MSTSYFNEQVHAFYDQFKQEILNQSQKINCTDRDGDLQDGYFVDLEDGYVRYKGMSWGFAFLHDPVCISMTFGPDAPFVGYSQIFKPEMLRNQINWVDTTRERIIGTPAQLAQYGLELLAAKLHEHIPLMPIVPSYHTVRYTQ